MHDFRRDDDWQRGVRDRILAPGFYAASGQYVFLDKGRLAAILQKRFAVDTIVQGRDGRAICIEEKIVRWPGYRYTAFSLETRSCTVPGRESDGWMVYGEADYLHYCFHQEDDSLDCYLIDFPRLKEWFWRLADSFPVFGPLETSNASMGRLVPIVAVVDAVPTRRRLVAAPILEGCAA